MGFLDKVGNFASEFAAGLNKQYGSGENTPRSLDKDDVPYGALGEFAKKIDKSAERSYIESGYIRNVKPRHFEVLMQEPEATILVKKKMFSSLINNYRYDLMDEVDRKFIKASKRLFQNKCQAISIYEKLCKVERLVINKGMLDGFTVPFMMTGINSLEQLGINIVSPETKSALNAINKFLAFSEPERYTTWLVDPKNNTTLGEGTGVIEITMAARVSANISTKLGGGGGSISISDPYKLMNITNEDINNAIADVFNTKQISQIFQFSESELSAQTNILLQDLNRERFTRGAPNISIKVSDNSILYKRVRVFVDEIGAEIIFSYDPGLMGVGAGIEFDSLEYLTNSDKKALSQILINTYQILNLQRQRENSLDDVLNEENKKTIRQVREKMRLDFGNKNIIQVMDSVHIFISSKTMLDEQIVGLDRTSLYGTGNNLLSMLNSAANKVVQSFNNIKGFFGGNTQGSELEAERDALVGPDFPMWLWSSMRNDFTRQDGGPQVCCGVVDKVTSNFAAESGYTLNVSFKDNSSYFTMGEINVSPGASPIDREIYDPYTPFDLEFDASTGFLIGEVPDLLPENQILLNSGTLRFKNGSRFINSPLSSFLYGVGDAERKNNGYQKIFFDPDGFVYRWKSGIGTLTFNGPKHAPSRLRENTTPKLTTNPFAGQDVMNVLSLLITGQPYNYNTFINSAVNNNALAFNSEKAGNDISNVSVASSFFRSLVSDLQQNNLAWGNFVPFKKLSISESGLQFLLLAQFNISKANAQISSAIEERAKLFDQLVLACGSFASASSVLDGASTLPSGGITQTDLTASTVTNQIQIQDQAISAQMTQLQQAISQPNLADGSMQIIGDDISLAPNVSATGDELEHERFRRRLKTLTLRRLWKVKANEDQNLLIVDDQYDKDYDIQAFERSLASGDKMQLFKSEYANILSQVEAVSSILGMEVFADTQGHIQIKPPGYNKIPSSVYERMVRDSQRIFPKALESLFVNQIDDLVVSLGIVEDEIRLRLSVIGSATDRDAEKYLNSGTFSSGSGTYTFKFLSNESNGFFGGDKDKPYSIQSLVQQDSVDLKEDAEYKALIAVDEAIAGQNRFTGMFNTASQYSTASSAAQNATAEDRFSTISKRIAFRTGQAEKSKQQVLSTDRVLLYTSQMDVLKLSKDITQLVSQRQLIIKQLNNAIKNVKQGIASSFDKKSQRALLYPSLVTGSKVEYPSVIAHMIEDENEDDLGKGSGGRYIIKENQIISMTIEETPPEFTTTEVVGLFGEGQAGAPAAGFEMGRGGNGIVSAIGVDYDLWRMYGFKTSQARPALFLSNPDTQAAPLAVWMLSEQRRKILTATVQMAGNEYMQPGEVVYIEDRDLLFYVQSVSHDFSYGGSFTTTLTLTYGHNPGEYFPTMLDIVGKGLYSKRNNSNLYKNIRTDAADGYQHVGIVLANSYSLMQMDSPATADLTNQLSTGIYGVQNRKTLNNLRVMLQGAYTSATAATGAVPKVEIRYFYNTSKGFPIGSFNTSVLQKTSQSIKDWLKNPTKQKDDSLAAIPDSLSDGLKVSDIDKNIKIIGVDLGDKQEWRAPSSYARFSAREIIPDVSSDNGSGILPDELMLYTNVIDVWFKLEELPTTISTSRLETGQSVSEANNKIQEELDKAKAAAKG